MADFKLEIVAPEGSVLQEEVELAVLPSVEGELGILAHHSPLISALKVGIIRYTKGGQAFRVATSGGFLEVANNKAVVLADTAERGDMIDLQRALAAKERALKRINQSDGIDQRRAELALYRALNRIKTVEGKD